MESWHSIVNSPRFFETTVVEDILSFCEIILQNLHIFVNINKHMMEAIKMPLLGMTLEQLQVVVNDLGMPRFTAGQICKWLYDKHVTDIAEMTDLSKTNRAKLSQHYKVGRYAPSHSAKSVDGTIKYLFPTNEEFSIESVYIPDKDRATLCISSQCGCKMNCYFCMTGRQGFHGNLSTCEIINQVLSIPQAEQLTNIVFMGMGEPLDNIDEVLRAIEIMTSKWGFAWSPKRITVSTIGIIPRLKQLLECTNVHVAISVHSPYHEERLSLMPIEKAYPLQKIFELLRNYNFHHQRRLSVEYIMWKGINDDDAHIDALAKILKSTDARVNLIRFHTIPGINLKPADNEVMIHFRDTLNTHGIICTIRQSRGEDIAAACGMLAGKIKAER